MSKNTKWWVIGGVAATGIALYVLVFRKKTLSNTGPSLNLAASPPAQTQAPQGTVQGPTGFSNPPASKNLYLSANAISIRSSPTVSNGLFGTWFTNQVGAAEGAGSYLGSIKAKMPDSGGDKNSATGQVWNWYNINLNPSIVVENADNYYVREDGVTIK